MKLTRIILGLVLLAAARAADIRVEIAMMTEPGGHEVTAYVADAPKLYAIFKTEGLKNGDKVRSVWIADDVGEAAPAETKINEKTITMDGDTNDGVFSLSQPTNGWPLGRYHIEVYVNDNLATKVKFEIKTASKSRRSSGEDDKEPSGD